MSRIDALPPSYRALIHEYGVLGFEEATNCCASVPQARAYLKARAVRRQRELLR